MQTTTFGVSGMTCGGCVNAVTKILDGVDGVETVTVSLASKMATVQFDEQKTDRSRLKSILTKNGYGVQE